MRKLFDQEVVSILPTRNGVIALVVKEQVADQFVVAYQLYSFDTLQVESVPRYAYLLGKFGNRFERYSQQLKDHLSCFTIHLPGNRLMVIYPTGSAGIFEQDGSISWYGDILYQDYGPADGLMIGDKLWFSFPQGNTVACYDLETRRYELRVGGNQTSSFISPEGLWYSDANTLLSCNTLANRIREIDLNTFGVEEYLAFDEPVYQYIKINAVEIVRLESGVYRL